MTVCFEEVGGSAYIPDGITELTLLEEADVPCGSLAVKFTPDILPDELKSVKVFRDGRLIFSGFVDTQRTSEDSNGTECFVYARSGICALVDNQAEPFTYCCPSTDQLFACCAKDSGFTNGIANISSSEKYEIPQGTSCYGAINSFVSLLTGSSVYADAHNELKIRRISEDVKPLESDNIIGVSYVINRSEPLTQIDYKRVQGVKYGIHARSFAAASKDINRRRFINLGSLPQWQREKTVSNRLKRSFDSYRLAEVKTAGFAEAELMQRMSLDCGLGHFEDLLLIGKKYVSDKSGGYTLLTFRQLTDIEEVTYVD